MMISVVEMIHVFVELCCN